MLAPLLTLLYDMHPFPVSPFISFLSLYPHLYNIAVRYCCFRIVDNSLSYNLMTQTVTIMC